MEFRELQDNKQLDDFLKVANLDKGAEFLQSWEWLKIETASGRKSFSCGAFAGEELQAVFTAYQAGPFYWYAPRGPIGSLAAQEFLIKEFKKRFPNAIFLRIEPRVELKIAGFKIIRTRPLQPASTLVLDLDLNKKELLSAMHQKTRYNIRLAGKKGVRIIPGGATDFSEFWRLMQVTGARDNFRLHESRHYQNLIEEGGKNGFIRLFFAEYEGRKIAAGLFAFFADKVTYLHGASDNEYRSLMAPYLLQWTIIQQAQEDAYRYYDFYGIDEKKWPGVTRFKQGFGGQPVFYPGTFDVVFKPFVYCLYTWLRKAKRFL